MSHKGYRSLDLSTRKIIISHHVVFDETSFPFAREPTTPTVSFDFMLDSDSDIAPYLTNRAAGGGSPSAAAPSSMDVEQPPSPSGGHGPVPPPDASGGRGQVLAPEPSAPARIRPCSSNNSSCTCPG